MKGSDFQNVIILNMGIRSAKLKVAFLFNVGTNTVVGIIGKVPSKLETNIWPADGVCTPCCTLDSLSDLKSEKLRSGF